ncbi:MAG: DUF1559 domain-containing protein [Pirellulaceae bacterium]
MKRPPTIFRCMIALATVISIPVPLRSQELPVDLQPKTDLINDVQTSPIHYELLGRFIETSSVALGEFDLTKIDAHEIASFANQVTGQNQTRDHVERDSQPIQKVIDSLSSAGAEKVYLIASLRSVADGGPLVVVPCDNPAAVDGVVSNVLKSTSAPEQFVTHVGEDALLLGPQVAIDRALVNKGADSDLLKLLKRGEKLDHTICIVFPSEVRTELAVFLPDQMPDSVPVKFSPRQLVSDLENLQLTWAFPPKGNLRGQVKTSDGSAAERVEAVLKNALSVVPELSQAVSISVDDDSVGIKSTPAQFTQLIQKAIAPAQEKNLRMMQMNDAKRVLLAFHNYHSAYAHCPPRCWTDKAGNPLLSWRVTILPFMGQQALYRDMKRGEAWNSKDNQTFTEMAVPEYAGSRPDREHPAYTRLRAPVYPGSLWHGDGPPKKFADVNDGLSNTIALIYAPQDAATPWTSPEPWIISEDDPMKDVFGDQDSTIMARLDGSVHFVKKSEMTNEKLKALLTIAGGEVIED